MFGWWKRLFAGRPVRADDGLPLRAYNCQFSEMSTAEDRHADAFGGPVPSPECRKAADACLRGEAVVFRVEITGADIGLQAAAGVTAAYVDHLTFARTRAPGRAVLFG